MGLAPEPRSTPEGQALARAVKAGGKVVVTVRCGQCNAPAATVKETPEGLLFEGFRRAVPAEAAIRRKHKMPRALVGGSIALEPWPAQLIAGCSKKHDLAYVKATDLADAVADYRRTGHPTSVRLDAQR